MRPLRHKAYQSHAAKDAYFFLKLFQQALAKLCQRLSQSSLNIGSKLFLHQFSILYSQIAAQEYFVNIPVDFKAFIWVIVRIVCMCFRGNHILFSGSNTTISASLPSAITPLLGYTPYSFAGFSQRSWHIFSTEILPVRTP